MCRDAALRRRTHGFAQDCQESGSSHTRLIMPTCSQHTPRIYTSWYRQSRRVNPSAARDGGKKFFPGTQQLLTLCGLFWCCCDCWGREMLISPRFQPEAPRLLPRENPRAQWSQGTIKL